MICVFILPISIKAQEKLVKEVQVVKPYEPTISDAFKITHLPVISDTVKTIPEVKYYVHTKPLNIGYTIDPIKPAKMVGEPLSHLYNSYVKLGLGTKLLPLFEVYLGNKRSKDYSVGAYYKLHNSYAQVKLDNDESEFAGFSDHDLQFFGKKFLKNSIFYGNLGLTSNTRYCYGYNTQIDTTLEKSGIKQNFLSYGLDAGYKSNYVDSAHINYDFKVLLDYTKDKFSNNEFGFGVSGNVNKIFTKQMVGVNLAINHYSVSENIDSVGNTIVKIHPWVGFFGLKWRVKAGINIASDLHGDQTKSGYYPVGSVEYDIANSYLIPYAGVDGKLQVNNFKTIAAQNPFLMPATGVKNTSHKVILFGGVRGNFNLSTYYNFKLSYSVVDDMPFYVNNLADTDSIGNKFDVTYDNIELTHYFGELSVSPSEKLYLSAQANYREYKMKNELKPWHIPAFDLTFSAKYNLKQKIILKADIFYIGKRYAKLDITGAYKELESAIDINFGAEYRYSKTLSAFVQLNNILSENYYQWNYYPTYGFNLLVGATYSF